MIKEWHKSVAKRVTDHEDNLVREKEAIEYYAKYFYDANVELFAVIKNTSKSRVKFELFGFKRLMDIMEGDPIFTDFEYQHEGPTWNRIYSNKYKILLQSDDIYEKMEEIHNNRINKAFGKKVLGFLFFALSIIVSSMLFCK